MSQAIFLEGDLKKHLFKMAMPGIISLLVNFSFAIVDALFVSQLGKHEMAAMGYSFVVGELIIGLSLGLGIGMVAKIGKSLGRKRYNQAKLYATAGTILMVVFSLILTVVGLLTIDPLFTMLGASKPVMSYVHSFMTVWYAGTVFLMFYFCFAFTFRAYGWAKSVMWVGIISAILNTVFDPILIFGWFGVPALGIAGAAWAGLIARVITAAMCLYFLLRSNVLCTCWSLSRYMHYWSRLMVVTIPATFTNLMPGILTTVTTYLLAQISQEAVASYGISTRVQWLAVIPLLACSSAVSALVAQNYGANRFDRAREAMNHTLLFSLIWGVIASIILAVFAHPIVAIFNQDQFVNEATYSYLYIVPIGFIGWGVMMNISATFNAMSQPTWSMMISIVRLFVLYMPMAFIMKFYMGYDGIYLGLTLSNTIAGLAAWALVSYKFNRCLSRGCA